MAKFTSPLGNELWITQTYHTGGNNTAIDLSANADVPVYALADGIVTYRSSGAGSYCIQTVTDSILKIYYVHTYKWVGANTFVKKGDVICYIAPTSLNGGYPTHLHLGLQVGYNIMDYFDRSIIFRTKYQAIKDIWFKGEDLDWSKFRDLSYIGFKVGDRIEFTGVQNIRSGSGTSYSTTSQTAKGMTATIIGGSRVANGYTWWDIRVDNGGTGWIADVGKMEVYTTPPVQPPVVPPESTECEKEVVRLQGEIDSLKASTTLLDSKLRESQEERKRLEGLLEAEKIEFKELEERYKDLEGEKNRFEEEKNEAVKLLNEYKNGRFVWIVDFLEKLFPKKK